MVFLTKAARRLTLTAWPRSDMHKEGSLSLGRTPLQEHTEVLRFNSEEAER